MNAPLDLPRVARGLLAVAGLALLAACVTPGPDRAPVPRLAFSAEPAALEVQESSQPAPLEIGPEQLPPSVAPAAGVDRPRTLRDTDEPRPGYGSINLIFGDRDYSGLGPDLEDLEATSGFGLEGVILPVPRVPLGLELGALYTSEEEGVLPSVNPPAGFPVELTTIESYVGLRLFLHRALPGGVPIEPFISAGYSSIFVDADADLSAVALPGVPDAVSVGDGSSGLYFRVGVQGRLFHRVHVGADMRWLDGADAVVQIPELPMTDVDLDYRQLSVFVGLRF